MIYNSKRTPVILSILLIIAIAMSSCAKLETIDKEGSKPTEAVRDDSKATPTPSPEPTAEPTAIITPEPTPTPEPVVESGVETFAVNIKNYYDSEWDQDNNRLCGSYSFDYPEMSEENRAKYPKLAEVFDDYYAEKSSAAKDILKSISDAAKGDEEFGHEYTRSDGMSVVRADSNIVSLLAKHYGFTGGIHGMYGNSGFCINTETGEEIKLKDIVRDKDTFINLVYDKLTTRFAEDDFLFFDTLKSDIIREFDDGTMCFEVGYNYLAVIFNPYDIFPYSSGITYVPISFVENGELFIDLVTEAPEDYMISFELSDGIRGDFNNDGTGDEIQAYYNYTNEYYDFDAVTFYLNNEPVSDSFLLDEECYGAYPVFIHYDGQNYLYVTYVFASEDTMTRIYRIDMYNGYVENADGNHYGTITDTGNVIWETIRESESSDPEHFMMDNRQDMIGTNFVKAAYRLDKNGLPVRIDDDYEFVYPYELTLKLNLTFKDLDSNGGESGEITLPAGTVLHMYKTDAESYVDLYKENNKNEIVRLYLRADNDWGYFDQTADGISLDDAFDGIIYAD